MAEQAQKEPTMEEILASIRKIISEDEEAPGARREPVEETAFDREQPADGGEPGLHNESELTLENVAPASSADSDIFDEARPEAASEPSFGASPAGPAAQPQDNSDFETEMELSPPPFAGLTAGEEDHEPVSIDAYRSEPSVTPSGPDRDEPAAFDEEIATAREETAMGQTERLRDGLTEDATADAAAGALSRLASRMEVGSDNTLEGLVRELIKPMIKVWLDENLQRIVEEKVEAEVQRISRMAR